MNYQMLNLKNYIKQELIDVCFQLWKKFDRGNSGYTDQKNLVIMLRLLRYNPTDKEINEMLETLKDTDPNCPEEKISKEGFLSCVARKERDTDSIEEFLNCFKLFDPGNTGLIEEKTLRYIMCNMGDKMANDEIDNVMKEANANFATVLNENIYINYVQFAMFVKDLYEPPPKEDPKKKKKK